MAKNNAVDTHNTALRLNSDPNLGFVNIYSMYPTT
jgi:hypothetical protein